MAAEGSSSSTGTGSDLPIFSGGTYLCETHEKMEALAGHYVWIDDFILMSCPQRRLIGSLLWHLHSKGICCAILGLFPGNLGGRFKQVLIVGIYIVTHGASESVTAQMILQYVTLSRYFTLGELKFTVLSPGEPRGFGVVEDKETSVDVLAIPVGSSAPAVLGQI